MKRRRKRTTQARFDPVVSWPHEGQRQETERRVQALEEGVQPSNINAPQLPNSFHATPTTPPAPNAVTTPTRPYTKHGLHAKIAAVSKRGISAIDGRSAEARALKSEREKLIERQGGEERLTPRERVLIDDAVASMALTGHANRWLRKQGAEVVSAKERAFVPLVAERGRLAERLASVLRELESLRLAPPKTVADAEQALREVLGPELGNALIETVNEGLSPAAMNAIERRDLEGFVAVLNDELQEKSVTH